MPSNATTKESDGASSRRHDLDALRAAAMLLGIAYHAALSLAADFPWLVQDVSRTRALYLFQAAAHGFRMPLFFLISGFFTAMLWRKRGLKALIQQRVRRILLPCLLGLLTIVPATLWVSNLALESGIRRGNRSSVPTARADLWGAVAIGSPAAVTRLLVEGADPNKVHPQWGTTPLSFAALHGHTNVAAQLLEHGAQVNGRNNDGGTALHAAAFLGRTSMVDLLIVRGADVQAQNSRGETALDAAQTDWTTTQFVASLLQTPLERVQVETSRAQIIQQLRNLEVKRGAPGPSAKLSATWTGVAGGLVRWLVQTPVFAHLWFLWFLCWLVGGFALYAIIVGWCGWKTPPKTLMLSPVNLLLLVALTMIPQWFAGSTSGGFGPDTSMGILPAPHVLVYYALFFGFGALYYDCDDAAGVLGRRWRLTLPLTLLIVFPAGVEVATGLFGVRDSLLPTRFHHPVAVGLQALYAWLMAFACMGMFRALLTRESPTIRYLSDSAYWLYLAHLPLIVLAQIVVSGWPLPAIVKFSLLTTVITGILLLAYDKAVRYTWLGTLLNGPRVRPAKQGQPLQASAPSTD